MPVTEVSKVVVLFGLFLNNYYSGTNAIWKLKLKHLSTNAKNFLQTNFQPNPSPNFFQNPKGGPFGVFREKLFSSHRKTHKTKKNPIFELSLQTNFQLDTSIQTGDIVKKHDLCSKNQHFSKPCNSGTSRLQSKKTRYSESWPLKLQAKWISAKLEPCKIPLT